MTFSPKNSRPATPSHKSRSYSYLYSPNHSRSKSSLPQPKVLPFPDLPVKPISSTSSRSGSPFPSPVPTRRSSSQDVTTRRVTNRDDNNNLPHTTSVGHPHWPSDVNPSIGINMARSSSSMSQLGSPSSPLATPSIHISPGNASTGILTMEAGPSRLRSSTTPSSSRPVPVPPVLNLNAPNRTHGFDPIPFTSPPEPSTVIPNQSTPSNVPRASSLPTSTPVREKPRPMPTKTLSIPPPSPNTTTTAMQITPMPSQQILNDHMYQSFLKGTCADVCLYVRKWGVGWHVHKMILVQAGFFHSMFLGGFSEMNGNSSSRKGKGKDTQGNDWHGEEVELTFDDPNITRAAFEISLSRLYSPYPHLHFPSILLTTPQSPLSPSFPPNEPLPDLRSIQASLPSEAILATPRLLLSIVATTIYLGHAALTREALAMVLRTVGPGTVSRYLAFATGDGIGDEEWEGQTREGARGLANVAKRMDRRESEDVSSQDHSFSYSNDSSQSLSDDVTKCGNPPLPTVSEGSTPIVRHRDNLDVPLSRQISASSVSDMPHFYGFASNKLGEACVCWLARWGKDILDIELASTSPLSDIRIWSHRGLPANFVSAIISSDMFFVRDEMERYQVARKVLELRRRGWEVEMEGRGDLSIHESIAESEDSNWDTWAEDEDELAKVFAGGIYYTHMNFDDLSIIASDIDPTTSLPFVPLSVLQAAHWAAANLRNKVLSPNESEDNELALTTTAAALAVPETKRRRVTPRSRQASYMQSTASLSSLNDASSKLADVYHPVPIDDTHRIGAGGLPFLTALATATTSLPGIPGIPGLPDLGPDVDSYSVEGARPSKFRPPPQGEKTAFGLLRACRTVTELLEEHALSLSGLSLNDTSAQRWTKADPYRFSVEFWGVDKLVEKERAYSTTHFYAGSWFNVYVQIIRKKDKGAQLGIYLHRQNPNEAFPSPSTPRPGTGNGAAKEEEREMSSLVSTPGGSALGLIGGTRMYRAMSVPPVTTGSPIARDDRASRNPNASASPIQRMRDDAEGVKTDDPAPYRDSRKVTRAYFSISCASALGTAVIRFSSAPDNFTISQSWGWKSSALRSEEYLTNLGSSGNTPGSAMNGTGEESLENGVLGWTGDSRSISKEGSLRATVVVGVV